MVSLVAIVAWRLPIYVVIVGFLVFGTLDGLYLSSAITKVPDGAWFTLCLAAFLSTIFILWRFGKENQWQAEASDKVAPWNLVFEFRNKQTDEPELRLTKQPGGGPVSSLRGVGIFFDKTGTPNGTPAVFVHFLQKFRAAPAVVVFFHIRPLPCPTVAPEDRFSVSRCSTGPGSDGALKNFYRVTIRHGYADRVISRHLGLLIYENLRNFIIHESMKSHNNSLVDESNEEDKRVSAAKEALVNARLNTLQAAYEDQVVYIVGKEQMRIDEVRNCRGWPRRITLAAFLWLRSNTGNKVANMDLEVEKLVEVGFVKVI